MQCGKMYFVFYIKFISYVTTCSLFTTLWGSSHSYVLQMEAPRTSFVHCHTAVKRLSQDSKPRALTLESCSTVSPFWAFPQFALSGWKTPSSSPPGQLPPLPESWSQMSFSLITDKHLLLPGAWIWCPSHVLPEQPMFSFYNTFPLRNKFTLCQSLLWL